MKLNYADLSNLKLDADLLRFLSQAFKQISDIVNGKLLFTDNLDIQIISCSFTAANQSSQFSHSLNRVPTGYITVGASSAMIVFSGATANTASLIYLQSSAAGTAQVLLF